MAVTVLAAAIPTILSAQGMVLVGYHALNLPMVTALALAGFCELALVASALSAREATMRGQSARVDLTATWLLSLVSGSLSACHEFIGTRADHSLQITVLAAIVRVVAPLIACWLWHRVVAGDAAEQADRSWSQRAADSLTLTVAVNARRCAQVSNATTRRNLERSYVRLLRRHPEVDLGMIESTVRAVAAVDQLPPLALLPEQKAPTPVVEKLPPAAPGQEYSALVELGLATPEELGMSTPATETPEPVETTSHPTAPLPPEPGEQTPKPAPKASPRPRSSKSGGPRPQSTKRSRQAAAK